MPLASGSYPLLNAFGAVGVLAHVAAPHDRLGTCTEAWQVRDCLTARWAS